MNFEPFTFILEKIGDLLIHEVAILSKDAKQELQNLQQELELAQSYLMEIDQVQRQQQVAIDFVSKTKVKHVMLLLPRVEELLENFYLELPFVEEAPQETQESSYFRNLVACFSSKSYLAPIRKHHLITTAAQLIEELRYTVERPNRYQLPEHFPQVTHKRRLLTQPHILNNEFIIGLEEDADTLVDKLVGKEGGLTTNLTIVGMGGSGKTTLARKLYSHSKIKNHFAKSAWVCVSKEWNSHLILHQMCADLGILDRLDQNSSPSAMLQKFLQNSSCLVVLDDVWKVEALQDLLPLLLSVDNKGSGRVLVTTRNEEIAKFPLLSCFHIHKVRRLTPQQSWDLFSKIVCNNWQTSNVAFENNDSFAELGKEMLKKCGGLPLAIVALAGLLCTKYTLQDWEKCSEDVISRIMTQGSVSHDYGAVKEMLKLSYDDLPYHLKPCFLYLGIFREDYQIDVSELIQLWIAEGFVKSNLKNIRSKTYEEVATDFVDDLVQRCMIQVVAGDYEGKVVAIQIHDLMRDLCIDEAKDLNFFEINSPSISAGQSCDQTLAYRTIIHERLSQQHMRHTPHIRSLICFMDLFTEMELPRWLRSLRVLYLKKVDLGDAADIGSMVFLRFLKVEMCSKDRKFLESVKKSRNLLTFIYYGNKPWPHSLRPGNIVGNTKNLRHLSLNNFFGKETRCQVLGLRKATNLQSLTVQCGYWQGGELHELNQCLQELKLYGIILKELLEPVYGFVSKRSIHLHTMSLHIVKSSPFEFGFDLEEMKLRKHSLLKNLELEGRISKQQTPLVFPPNLLTLCLHDTEIEEGEDLQGALAQLLQLRRLTLYNAYMASEFSMIRLSQLQDLSLWNLSNLKEWRIEQGALSRLKTLEIYHCKQLERIPKGVSNIHTLQSLKVGQLSESCYKRLLQPLTTISGDDNADDVGQDFHVIQHIPSIFIGEPWKTCSVASTST